MSVRLDHIIVRARDKHASGAFPAELLGVQVDPPSGPIVPVRVANGVTLDYLDSTAFSEQHCAFLVDERVRRGTRPDRAGRHPVLGPPRTLRTR